MLRKIDDFLNNITMYRLVLYYLIFLLIIALIYCLFGVLPYNFLNLFFSVVFITSICWVTNKIFARIFKSPTNLESVYITALILSLIVAPVDNSNGLIFLVLISVAAIASKFIIAINKKHIFNPAAFAVVFTSITINQFADWWVGSFAMMPFVFLGGLLVVRKIRKPDLVLSFLFVTLFALFIGSVLKADKPLFTLQNAILNSELLFFCFIMLTEPQTLPPTRKKQIFYGSVIGLIYGAQISIGSYYTTAEIALLTGNIFSWMVSPKEKLILTLKQKLKSANGVYDFVFTSDRKLNFNAGQYLEWTLSHKNPDTRGNRRFFTIASSPTENNMRIGVKFYGNSSSFKKAMLEMDQGSKIMAGSLNGDFTLPKDLNKKLVFIAGGIGVTPFRSIVKYLTDKDEKRDIVLIYSNKSKEDIAYLDIFNSAEKNGVKTIYTLTEVDKIPADWSGEKGMVSQEMIAKDIPDYKDRIFYISGPHAMVDAYEDLLKQMGIKSSNIVIDYFPGYA